MPPKRVPLHTPNRKSECEILTSSTVQQQVLAKEIAQHEQVLTAIKQELARNLQEHMTLIQNVEEAWQDDELFADVQVEESNKPYAPQHHKVPEVLEKVSLRDSNSKWLQRYTTKMEALLETELARIRAISDIPQQVQQQNHISGSKTAGIESDDVHLATGRTVSVYKVPETELRMHITELIDKENELSGRIRAMSMVLDVLKEKQQQLL